MNPPSPVTSPAPKTPGRASSVAGSTFNQPRSVCASPAARQASALGRRPVATSSRSAADDRARLQVEDDRRARRRPTGRVLDGDAGVADHQRDAIRLQMRPQRRASLRFLVAEERRSRLDHGHPGAEACEGLPELDADGAAAEDRQGGRQLPRNRRLAIGPELDRVEPGNGGIAALLPFATTTARRATSCSPPTSTVRGSVSLPSPRKSVAPVASNRRRRPAVVEVARHPQHALRHLRKVDAPSPRARRRGAGAAGLAQRFAGTKQRLRRHAAPVRALAADELPLDHRQRQPAVVKAGGDRFTSDAAAETHDVELLDQL